ncbi:hypothetical protein LGZ99_23720 [Photorhabdus temperata]|uniref:Uncharacterized protein n=1 Tax=Photorhabdus temperata subsp. temperata Meg1 TaxID=1393735 RepID=A0A081RQV6_PHOTE|nr:hypothetical protein [Photorhabdus temperata]KER01059.1 hypothetical protein MEG1DRAFT_04330 [Photorhabdus temperata subsp. temperata Meg1]MCT8350120.1 hypothetical protein [Photorhabdus temperata]
MNSNSLNKQRNTSYIEIEDALGKIEALAGAAGYLDGNKEEVMLCRELISVIHSVASEVLKKEKSDE